jgi:hypothetical protein
VLVLTAELLVGPAGVLLLELVVVAMLLIVPPSEGFKRKYVASPPAMSTTSTTAPMINGVAFDALVAGGGKACAP